MHQINMVSRLDYGPIGFDRTRRICAPARSGDSQNCQRVTKAKVLKLKHMWCQRDSYIFYPKIQPTERIFLQSKTDHLLLCSQHLRNFRVKRRYLSVDPNPNPTLLSDHTTPGLSSFAIFAYTLCGKGCQIISDLASLF